MEIEIKPLGGIAGDMFVGACAALWPERVADCLADLAAVLPEGVSASFERVRVNGFAAEAFRVEVGDAPRTGRYAGIVQMLRGSPLDEAVREEALAILCIIGEAEAETHGVPLDDVHFHELADWDSIADVVAAASFITRAGAAHWAVGALPLGGGTVETQHGRVPVPAPAVLKILDGYSFEDDGVGGERVTPTGAAILRRLTTPGDQRPYGRLAASGFGAGTKRFEGLANVVQLVAFEAAAVQRTQQVTEIAFDIDDMTGEELAVAADRLRAAEGVLDVRQIAQVGKKGRPLTGFRVLAADAAVETVAAQCFAETSTLGLRIASVERRVLDRRAAATEAGAVKIAERAGGPTAKVESDDLLLGATLSDRRAQARAAEDAALEGGDD